MSPMVKARRLRAMLEKIARDQNKDLPSLRRDPQEVVAAAAMEIAGGLESVSPKRATERKRKAEQQVASANAALEKLALRQDVSPEEADGLEAIILLRERPVSEVDQDDDYADLDEPWGHLNTKEARGRLQPALSSIGRIELPLRTNVPYGGTGFVVGKSLMMTNRHVAKEFTSGVGTRDIIYTTGGAAVDFGQQLGARKPSMVLEVKDVLMIHPFWDMALLQVDGLPANRGALKLSTKSPDALRDSDAVVIGYPAEDSRNDAREQQRIFKKTFRVKRLQPGKVRQRQRVESFKNIVLAMTHDASTLGGNSGSAIIDVETGHVIGLHFGGVYLRTNYGVPMFELARDPRVIDAGLSFVGEVPSTDEWDHAWAAVEGRETPQRRRLSTPRSSASSTASSKTIVPMPAPSGNGWTIPLNLTLSIGGSAPVGYMAGDRSLSDEPDVIPAAAIVETLRVPKIFDDLETRSGYQEDFLGVAVPAPKLTPRADKLVAKLEDGTPHIHYHRFSVVLHKKRRLALFTAANVDWRPKQRLINGKKPTRRELTELGNNDQEKWVTDPRIPDNHQLPDIFYTKDDGAFDKGHLVRRDDVAWGNSFEDIQMGNGDTYHTTNCSPQIASFNRSGKSEGDDDNNWGDLENLIQKETKAEKAIIFSGPVLDDDDRFFHGRDERGKVSIQIPTKFWKIVVTKNGKSAKAFGFLLEQDLSAVPTHDEMSVPPEWDRSRASIEDIEKLLGGLASLDHLKRFDQFESEEAIRIEEALL